MGNNVIESTRQSFVVMKNEIKKFFSGKRMIIFLALLAVVLAVFTFAPYLVGNRSGLPHDSGRIAAMYLTMSSIIVLVASTLFASISIVSEYEERTALIIFTRPIRKISIFAGKFLASFVVTIGFIALYYAVIALVSFIVAGNVDPTLIVSLGLCFAYAFGTTGIAMAISSVMKKSSTSTIITFVTLLVIVMAISTVLSAASVDVSWMIDQASNSITSSNEGYRDTMNTMMTTLVSQLSDPMGVVNFDNYSANLALAGYSINPDVLYSAMRDPNVFLLAGMNVDDMLVKAPDVIHDAVVMIAWGLVSLAASFVLFLRREF